MAIYDDYVREEGYAMGMFKICEECRQVAARGKMAAMIGDEQGKDKALAELRRLEPIGLALEARINQSCDLFAGASDDMLKDIHEATRRPLGSGNPEAEGDVP